MHVLEMLTPRTVLLPIEPIAADSPRREALTSYFRRLSAENGLRVSRTFSGLVMPHLTGIRRRRTSNPCPDYDFRFISAAGKPAREWVMTLEGLTGVTELSRLTLLSWRDESGRAAPLPEHRRKWCPACYQQALDHHEPVYDQLAWTIRGFDYCPEHHRLLERRCAHCGGGPFAHLAGNDVAGFCPSCHKWLGSYAVDATEPDGLNHDYTVWTALSIASLLSVDDRLVRASRENQSAGINKLIDVHFAGSASAFGRALNRSKSIVFGWRHGRWYPTWDAWCQISYCFQIPLRELLIGSVNLQDTQPPRNWFDGNASARRSPKRRDWDKIKKFLVDIRQMDNPRFSSMIAIAQHLGIHARLLSSRLPQEYEALSIHLTRKRRHELVRARDQKHLTLKAKIHDAIGVLLETDQRLSRRNIERVLCRTVKLPRSKFHILAQCIAEVRAEAHRAAQSQ